MEIVTIALIIISIILSIIALIGISKLRSSSNTTEFAELQSAVHKDLIEQIAQLRGDLVRNNTEGIATLAHMLRDSNAENFARQNETLKTALEAIHNQLKQFEQRLANFSTENIQSLESIRKTVDTGMQNMREDNNKKLDEMRKTVDEKLQSELQKRMNDSFAQVTKLMGDLQKDIGSMRGLAEDVGGLKRSLTNVKTRGMMGEFQLENILREVFSPSQYEKNAHTNPNNTSSVVEFAIKIPTEDDTFIYLPIDSKFPQDRYQAVLDANDTGDKSQIDAAMKAYTDELKRCADEIKKYIAPPYTTNYAIMFLPTESMYADAINQGMLDTLWRRAQVYIAGPSTVAALLSSMQLSFNNLAIRKRANEVFGILMEVQDEFNKFADALAKTQKHLRQTDEDLTTLVGTRTKAMQRKLNKISNAALGEPNEADTPSLPSIE